jgi:uncharacterized membrane protein YhdT
MVFGLYGVAGIIMLALYSNFQKNMVLQIREPITHIAPCYIVWTTMLTVTIWSLLCCVFMIIETNYTQISKSAIWFLTICGSLCFLISGWFILADLSQNCITLYNEQASFMLLFFYFTNIFTTIVFIAAAIILCFCNHAHYHTVHPS